MGDASAQCAKPVPSYEGRENKFPDGHLIGKKLPKVPPRKPGRKRRSFHVPLHIRTVENQNIND